MENNLQTIKKQMKQKQGALIKIRAKAGRRGASYGGRGVIEGLYPDVFTVLVDEHGHYRRYCFCYSEILTRHVEIAEDSGVLLSASCKT